MHDVLFYESFFFCSRDDLERLQVVSKSLLKMIVKSSNVLPLRPIYRVQLSCRSEPHAWFDVYNEDDKIQIFLGEDDVLLRPPEPSCTFYSVIDASEDYGDFEEAFIRLQNTCIMNFWDGSSDDIPFLRYWMEQETTVFTVVNFCFDHKPLSDLLGFMMNHLPSGSTKLAVAES